MATKFEVLDKVATIFDTEALSKKDFENNFKKILELLLKRDQQLARELQALRETYNALIERINKEHGTSLKELKTQTNQLFVGQRLDEMSAAQRDLFDGLKGEITDLSSAQRNEITEKMKSIRSGKDADGAAMEKKLSGMLTDLTKTQKAEVETMLLKKTDEMDKLIRKGISSIPKGGFGMRKVPIMRRLNLSSQTDGSTRAFNVPKDTVSIYAIMCTDFPIIFDDADFTLAGTVLTLSSDFEAPSADSSLVILAESLFYP